MSVRSSDLGGPGVTGISTIFVYRMEKYLFILLFDSLWTSFDRVVLKLQAAWKGI